ncbi:MAG: hypothetical protein C7B45_00235 [Sulfobacillus acidophilus]|uniref:CcmD family protein n=1 Tax=Sulfobacillus acidophilus TaxID=53633 RepID=A0A2T2WPC0_9FIRM|nr:MAG: hypothetical protein C7B45_00235 [Sulfobacillus acidophilus]
MSSWEHVDLQYLFYGYSAAWVMMCTFLVRMDRRTRRLTRDLSVLQQALTESDPTTWSSSRDQTWPGPSV